MLDVFQQMERALKRMLSPNRDSELFKNKDYADILEQRSHDEPLVRLKRSETKEDGPSAEPVRSLEDMTEDEIEALEKLYGCKVRRPK